MSPFPPEGTFTTESREVAVSETWDTWSNPQESNNVEVVDGSLQLAETTVLIIEDFEDNDLSNYAGDTGAYAITSSDVVEGSFALETTGGDNTPFISDTGSSLPYYPSKGDVVACLLRETSETDNSWPGFMFGVQDAGGAQDGYMVLINQNGEVRLQRIDDGAETTLASDSSVGYSTQEWVDVEAEWHDGTGTEADNTIVVTVYSIDPATLERQSELTSISATDSNYATNDGVGFGAWTSSTSAGTVADYYRRVGPV